MAFVDMATLLTHARERHIAIAAFECWSSDNIYALTEAAAACDMPIILQASPTEYQLMGGAMACRKIAEYYVEMTGTTAALHLDHGSTLQQVKECVDAGFTSVMLDASRLPYAENVALTRAAVEIARPHHVSVEAELGHVGGSEAEFTETEQHALLTDPGEAERFVHDTGIDCLAVAIGTVHGDYRGTPNIDLQRLADIATRIPLPLVLHGGSGTPQEILAQAIGLGIAKINICTDIHKAWLAGVAQATGTLTPSVPGNFYHPAHTQLRQTAAELITFFSKGQSW